MVGPTITSDPDKDGKHRLQCPQCLVYFSAPTTKDDKTGELQDIICENCHHVTEPLMFIYTANKEQTDAMVMNYAERKMKNMLKKRFVTQSISK
jgi:hypothetical protein